MTCKKFLEQLDSYTEGRIGMPLSADMQAHLGSCASCRAHLQIHQRMLTILEHDEAPALPLDFTERILDRLEPATLPNRAKVHLVWKRVAVYVGYAILLGLALWFGYKNAGSVLGGQRLSRLLDNQLVNQIQRFLADFGVIGFLQSFRKLFSSILSFIPMTKNLIEKSLGKEVLPQGLHFLIVVMMTYMVVKASVLIEGWLRQVSRRNS